MRNSSCNFVARSERRLVERGQYLFGDLEPAFRGKLVTPDGSGGSASIDCAVADSAANGEAAAPPRKLMKSRRLMRRSCNRAVRTLISAKRTSAVQVPMSASGTNAKYRLGPEMSAVRGRPDPHHEIDAFDPTRTWRHLLRADRRPGRSGLFDYTAAAAQPND